MLFIFSAGVLMWALILERYWFFRGFCSKQIAAIQTEWQARQGSNLVVCTADPAGDDLAAQRLDDDRLPVMVSCRCRCSASSAR